MFSIIIPLYNKVNFVEKTIKSVLNQTYSDFEIIVVNDGSTDGSLQVIESLRQNDDRVILYSKQNEGVSIARNYGIKKAKFNYIVLLDADDIWEPDFLETILFLIQKYPEASAFCTGYSIVTNKIQNEIFYGEKNETYIINDYCGLVCTGKISCCSSAICIKKEDLLSVGLFRKNIKRGEDLDLWVRIACKYKIAYHASTKAIYIKNSENNATESYKTYKESFPYWEWYSYKYSPKKSLIRYTTQMIIALCQSAMKNKKYNEVKFLLSKCQGNHKAINRLCLYIRAYVIPIFQ